MLLSDQHRGPSDRRCRGR